jgi:hypothetical protein
VTLLKASDFTERSYFTESNDGTLLKDSDFWRFHLPFGSPEEHRQAFVPNGCGVRVSLPGKEETH